jgi:hypothetical protein
VPRNIVTLDPRSSLFGRKRHAQERVLAAVGERYRFRKEEAWVEIDFPKRMGDQAQAQVVTELDRIEPNWRLFRIHPRE